MSEHAAQYFYFVLVLTEAGAEPSRPLSMPVR